MSTQTHLAETGELQLTPLPRLILSLAKEHFDGALSLRCDSREKCFRFLQGAPVMCESNLAGDSLARHLTRTRLLSEDDVRKVQEWTRSKGDHEGLAMLRLGLLQPATLFEAMKGHLSRALREAFGWRDGTYRIERDTTPDPRLRPFRSDPLPLVQQGLEAYWDVERLFDALRADLIRFPSPQPSLTRLLARLEPSKDFDPTQWSPARSLAEHLKQAQLSPGNLSTLWVLKECGAIRLLASKGPVKRDKKDFLPESLEIEVVSPKEVAPIGTQLADRPSRDLEDYATELRQEIRQIQDSAPGQMNHYRLLGVDHQVSSAGLKKAYQRAAKRYHPDTLARRGAPDLGAEAARVFAQITEAYEVLRDPKRKKDYDAGRTGEGAELEADRIAHAEVFYRKAEVLLRMGNFAEAAQYLRRSVDLCPQEPAFQSDLGWALYKMTPSDPAAAQQSLKQAVAAAPHDEVARFRLGVVSNELAQKADSATQGPSTQELETHPT